MDKKALQRRIHHLEIREQQLEIQLKHKEISILGLINEADELRTDLLKARHILDRLATAFAEKKCATHCNFPDCTLPGCVRKIYFNVIPQQNRD